MRNVQEPVQSGMLLKYNHIRRFSFQNSTGFRPSFSPAAFPNLEFNTLEQLRTFNYCVEDIQMLHSKAGVWPLTHLNMRWIQVTDLPLVLQAISGFSNTLKHLQIEFRGVRAHEFEGLSQKLELPHLESLKITAVQSYLNVIDFLVPCGELKKLEMEIWIPSFVTPSFDTFPPQTIQFGGCASSMYNSNIWRLLPNLNKMLIRTVTNRPTRPEAPVHDWFLYSRSEYLELFGSTTTAPS
ncbi:hypothetical protein Ocin01_17611 [Orchesella cincta]|uniref:Uncharacterized protein n=1 Tax=Orchesella cincta TaxID=48709 RepID=A0A1D2M7X2_ORCCI|nr:hypothetical protein Ocin01_17611 [Orchesella cincta]